VIRAEFILQRKIFEMVARCVVVGHEFASHDRGFARSEHEHRWEAARGIRSNWPDTELALAGGRTFRCELKRPGVRLKPDSEQARLIDRLTALEHPAAWANSVVGYFEQCARFGVPLCHNWRTLARLADEQVAAEIIAQRAKASRKPAAAPKARYRRPTPLRFARLQRARKPL
jgi:hypothetical protein